jgi:hypothetical protein
MVLMMNGMSALDANRGAIEELIDLLANIELAQGSRRIPKADSSGLGRVSRRSESRRPDHTTWKVMTSLPC